MIKYSINRDSEDKFTLTILSDNSAILDWHYRGKIVSQKISRSWLLPPYGSPRGTKADISFLSKFFKFAKERGLRVTGEN